MLVPSSFHPIRSYISVINTARAFSCSSIRYEGLIFYKYFLKSSKTSSTDLLDPQKCCFKKSHINCHKFAKFTLSFFNTMQHKVFPLQPIKKLFSTLHLVIYHLHFSLALNHTASSLDRFYTLKMRLLE